MVRHGLPVNQTVFITEKRRQSLQPQITAFLTEHRAAGAAVHVAALSSSVQPGATLFYGGVGRCSPPRGARAPDAVGPAAEGPRPATQGLSGVRRRGAEASRAPGAAALLPAVAPREAGGERERFSSPVLSSKTA